jgi:hypothetical protein
VWVAPELPPVLLLPPLLAPLVLVAPARLESEPPLPAVALPPSLEELEQATKPTMQAKPRETLLLVDSRRAGFMACSVSRARVASATRIPLRRRSGTAALSF